MDGITILGLPIGSKEYINKTLKNLAILILTSFRALKSNLDIIKTIGQLFYNSLLPKFYHALCTDAFSERLNSTDIFHF